MDISPSVAISRPREFVAVIEMGTPGELNLWNPEVERGVFDSFHLLAADDTVRVIGLMSRGRAFCAGGDLAGVRQRMESREAVAAEAAAILDRQVLRALAIPKPVVAAMHSHCVGMGFALALACDFRIVTSDVRIQAGFPRRGLVAEHGTSWLLPRIVGLGDALDILLSGRTIRSEEALAMRLVHKVVDPADLQSALADFSHRLVAASSPRSQAIIKRQIYRDLQLPFAESAEVTAKEMVASFRAPDAREGVTSFLEGREAVFPPPSPLTVLPEFPSP